MENIGITNWFTKIREECQYPAQSEKLLEALIPEIIESFNLSDLARVADNIYKVLSNKLELQLVCSDSRLPTVSLYHHLKNTSGVAVCLACKEISNKNIFLLEYDIENNYSDKDFIAIIRIASLLHDIGKLRSYSEHKTNVPYYFHTTQTKEIIEEILAKARQDIVEKHQLKKILPYLASRHHSRDAQTKLEGLISSADSVASAADRTYEVSGKFIEGTLTVQSEDKIFPHLIDFSGGDLQCDEVPNTEIIGYRQEISKKVRLKTNEKTIKLFQDLIVDGGPMEYLGTPRKLSGTIGILALDIIGIQAFIREAEKLPMLRGGSAIITEVLEKSKQLIEREVCPEAVLFCGGGNLLAFIPVNMQESLKKKITELVKSNSGGGLKAGVIAYEEKLDIIAGSFNSVLAEVQNRLQAQKNKSYYAEIKHPKKRDDVCEFCGKRIATGICNEERCCTVCAEKRHEGIISRFVPLMKGEYIPREILEKYKLNYPMQLEHIGDSIAVLTLDGNMMGRIFGQTKTPAEYTFKSEEFDKEFKSILKNTIYEFASANIDLVKHKVKAEKSEKEYFGIDVLYVGGDDVKIIMNARGAIKFCEEFIKKVAKEFCFKKKILNQYFRNPVVTISCGIAVADYKFPIYFLLDKSSEMEGIAKKAFRKKTIKCENEINNILKIPIGSLAFTSVSSAMPSMEKQCFVLPYDQKDLDLLNEVIAYALDKNKDRATISSLITLGNSELERLHFVKYLYSSLHRKKEKEMTLKDCEWMVEVLSKERVLNSAKMLVPQVWHFRETT
ncbi:MAG: HD domain-containing protein [Methanosarcinales archaeon]